MTLPRVHYPETGLSLQQMLVAGASEPDTAPGRPGGAPGSLRPQELEVISKLCLGIRVRSGDHVTAAQVGFDPCLQAWASSGLRRDHRDPARLATGSRSESPQHQCSLVLTITTEEAPVTNGQKGGIPEDANAAFPFQVCQRSLIEISCHDGPFETLRNAVKGRSCRLGLPFPPRPPPGPGPGGLPVFWACWAGPTSTLVTITFIGRSFEQ